MHSAESKVSANMNISIYGDNGQTDPALIEVPSNLLQTMKYHSSCSRNLFLKDRFGANQIVQWVSSTVGTVSCFINTTIDLQVGIPITTSGGQVRLTELGTLSNILGFINQTDQVYGTVVAPGSTIAVDPIPITLDLTKRIRYTWFTTIVGQTVSGTQECNGDAFLAFTAGNPLPPIFPTLAPSAAPTRTPLPTPDPLTTACNLQASIACSIPQGPTTSCATLSAPAQTTCSGGSLTDMTFSITGANCGSSANCQDSNGGPSGTTDLYIVVSDSTGAYFSGAQAVGNQIDIRNPTGFTAGTVTITTSTIATTTKGPGAGTTLQTVTIPTSCTGSGLTLAQAYGAYTLLSYTAGGTEYATYATVRISYSIGNASPFKAFITSGIISSFFSGPNQQQFTSPTLIGAGGNINVFSEEQTINLADASQQPAFVFGFNVTGVADNKGGLPCASFPVFYFQVAPA